MEETYYDHIFYKIKQNQEILFFFSIQVTRKLRGSPVNGSINDLVRFGKGRADPTDFSCLNIDVIAERFSF